MAVTDPRADGADVLEYHVEETVSTGEFEDRAAMEAFRSGWVAVAYAFDDDGRVLLNYHEDDDHWRAPGGTLHPGESLAEGLRREVREEAGVDVTPRAPRAVADVVVTEAGGDRSTSFSVVSFEATPETTDVGENLGVDDEDITDADWFGALPGDLYDREGTEEVLDACDRWTW
jgi:8-oxo-dGTP diphosphatase